MNRNGFTIVEVISFLIVAGMLVFVFSSFRGCVSTKDGAVEAVSQLPAPAQPARQHADSDLRGRLIGKWQLLEGYWKGSVVDFTSGGKLLIALKWKYGDEPDRLVGTFIANSGHIRLGAGENEGIQDYDIEFLPNDELLLHHAEGSAYRGFEQLEGRWQQLSTPEFPADADSNQQVRNLEKKLARLEEIHKAALDDRDDLAAKLRSVGVNSPADLKNNLRGRRLAENVVRLATEIDGLERQLILIDGELLKAKSIVRHMEREQAGLSEQELRNLTQQLREVEERTDGIPQPSTPLDVDTAVERALKAHR
jgi:hypothetical protein